MYETGSQRTTFLVKGGAYSLMVRALITCSMGDCRSNSGMKHLVSHPLNDFH